MFDYHIHTKSSADSTAEPSDIVRAAADAGLSEICLTNHADINHHVPDDYFPFDLDEMAADYRAASKAGAALGVAVKNGIEIGVDKETLAEYESLLDGRSYDFIICSQHFIDGVDPYEQSYFSGKSQREAYEAYLAAALSTLSAFNGYSVVGHIGYAAKYCRTRPAIMDMDGYGDYIEEILKVAVSRGKGIEVNTSGIKNTGEPMAAYSVVKRFIELGGEIVTMGSDAHEPSRVGDRFAETAERLRAVGLRYVCTYDRMKPVFHSL